MKIEIREDKQSMHVSGYVNVVGRDSRELRDSSGPFIEQIAPGAFAKALSSGNPVELRFNHSAVLDDTNGSLSLNEDNVGLFAECEVTDKAVISAADHGELRGWSFGFVCDADSWETREDGSRHRTVNDMELREVSILTKTPAYIATTIETRDGTSVMCEFREFDAIEPDVTRTTDRKTEEVTTTEDEWGKTESILMQKTVEIYKLKRR